ncbi:MAG: P-loop NTPase, partial [Albimonas sp.]|uniref:P-loop NTPase n=1 Tax=Albimonas sp. TaxID=1872425 RepID=UPI004056A48E
VFVCPHCGQPSHIFGHDGAKAEAQRLGLPFLGEIPLHLDIRVSGDAGAPIVATAPEAPQSRAFRDLAAKLIESGKA